MKRIAFFVFTALSLFSENLSAQNKPLYTAPFGVQAYTFRRSFPIDVAKTLDTIKMMGFTEIEGGGGRITPQEFKKLCDERGISIPATGASYDQLVNKTDPQIPTLLMRSKTMPGRRSGMRKFSKRKSLAPCSSAAFIVLFIPTSIKMNLL